MRLLKQAAIVAALMFGIPIIAVALWPLTVHAQDMVPAPADTLVAVPFGNWAADVLTFLGTLIVTAIGAVLTWALAFVPATLRAYITDQTIKQVEQLLKRAVDHGINIAVANLRGRTIDVDVRHEVLEDAVQYAIEHGPSKLIAWMGGADGIREKILARLPWQIEGGAIVDPLQRTVAASHVQS